MADAQDQLISFLRTSGLTLLVAVIVAMVAFRISRPIVHRAVVGVLDRRRAGSADQLGTVEEAHKRAETLELLVARLLRAAVVVLFILVVLTVFDLLPVIAGLGLVVAALTVAWQDIIRDYIMGVLIILEGQYFNGDWIQVGGVEGTVEEVGLRRTVLRDATGTVHSVSNGEIRVASNLTRFYALMIVDVTVGFGTDLAQVTKVIDEVGRRMSEDPTWGPRLLETPGLIRVGSFTDLGVPLRIGGRVRAADRFTATGELRKRILVALQENEVDIPGVHRFVQVPPSAVPGSPSASARPGAGAVPDDLPPVG
jgi:small-conductance mechanosensitive channel